MTGGRATWLIAYDIREEKRLRRVHKFVSRLACPLQFSLFVADLDAAGLDEMQRGLAARADPRVDDVRIYRLRADATGAWQGPLPQGDDAWLFGSPALRLAERFRRAPWRARLDGDENDA